MNKIEFALESFKNIQNLIKFIDQKSSLVLVVTGLIFTGYVEFIKKLVFVSPMDSCIWGILTFFSGLLTMFFLILIIYISAFKILTPQKAKHYGINQNSLFYYEHLIKTGKEEIKSKYTTVTEEKMLEDIIDQQQEIALILNSKQNAFKTSVRFLFLALLSVITFILATFQL